MLRIVNGYWLESTNLIEIPYNLGDIYNYFLWFNTIEEYKLKLGNIPDLPNSLNWVKELVLELEDKGLDGTFDNIYVDGHDPSEYYNCPWIDEKPNKPEKEYIHFNFEDFSISIIKEENYYKRLRIETDKEDLGFTKAVDF